VAALILSTPYHLIVLITHTYSPQGSKSFAASIRDFRHYLSSIPAPGDSVQVAAELEGVIEANRR
jgi:hypothetical protein